MVINSIVILFVWIGSMILGGFTFQKLWEWFVIPVFNLPYLSIVQCLGLFLLASLFKDINLNNDEDSFSKIKADCLIRSLVCVVLLIEGFILKQLL